MVHRSRFWHTDSMSEQVPTARARARAGMIEDIKRSARVHLAQDGPNLSLRAVARDIGVVSSAVYRYFASRDDLLTALIIDAYNDLGEAVETAEAAVARRDLSGRWLAAGRAIRDWARANPHEYALVYGSPVPGYAAPQDTIGPASRSVMVLMSILRDRGERGPFTGDRLPRAVRADLENVATFLGFEHVPPPILARGMTAWAQLFGTLSFELFGRLVNAVTDYDAYFDHQLRAMSGYLGLSS
jgi:AcrR family transcriptional regulator